MGQIAQEMNHSETAFIQRIKDAKNTYSISWVEPAGKEIKLSGHSLLASAHILWSEGHVPESERITFKSNNATLHARRVPEGEISSVDSPRIELDLPEDVVAGPYKMSEPIKKIFDAIGVWEDHVVHLGKNTLDYCIELDSEEHVMMMNPSHQALVTVSDHMRAVMVTAKAPDGASYDYV